jgi:hypothetical protein
MDIEGYELPALRGASALTRRHRPVFLIEFGLGDGLPNDCAALGKHLADHGYELFAMVRQSVWPWRYNTTLQLIQVEQLTTLSTKMLFLVPQEEPFFQSKAAAGWCFEEVQRRKGFP